jgi:hypothetical protein
MRVLLGWSWTLSGGVATTDVEHEKRMAWYLVCSTLLVWLLVSNVARSSMVTITGLGCARWGGCHVAPVVTGVGARVSLVDATVNRPGSWVTEPRRAEQQGAQLG